MQRRCAPHERAIGWREFREIVFVVAGTTSAENWKTESGSLEHRLMMRLLLEAGVTQCRSTTPAALFGAGVSGILRCLAPERALLTHEVHRSGLLLPSA
jgi:hypothetical protein